MLPSLTDILFNFSFFGILNRGNVIVQYSDVIYLISYEETKLVHYLKKSKDLVR